MLESQNDTLQIQPTQFPERSQNTDHPDDPADGYGMAGSYEHPICLWTTIALLSRV